MEWQRESLYRHLGYRLFDNDVSEFERSFDVLDMMTIFYTNRKLQKVIKLKLSHLNRLLIQTSIKIIILWWHWRSSSIFVAAFLALIA